MASGWPVLLWQSSLPLSVIGGATESKRTAGRLPIASLAGRITFSSPLLPNAFHPF